MKQRLFLFFASLMMLLSACGGKDVPADSGTPRAEPVELVVYYPFGADWTEDDFMNTFGKPIMQKYPNITIKYIGAGPKGTSVPELLAAGQPIDILFTSIGSTPVQLLNNNLQYDIEPLIKKFNYDLNQLEPSMVDTTRRLLDGKLYGLPGYVPPAAIYYNKDIFDKFGVSYPKDGITWDELYELNKKLTRKDGDVQYLGLGSSYGHFTLLNQWSLPLVDTQTKKAVFGTDDRWKAFVENLVRFYKIPGYELSANQMSEPNERNRFFKDRIIAMFLAQTALHSASELQDMNWDLASFPVFKENPDVGPQAYPINFYVTSISQHKDQAFQAIAYIASEEFQMQRSREGRLLTTLASPAVREAFGSDNPMYKGKNVKALWPRKYATAGSVNKYNSSIASGELNTAIKEIILGQKDVNTALREAAERTDKRIEQAESGN